MKIIRITAGADGSRPPIQTWTGDELPEGYAALPAALDDGTFEAANGFVELTFSPEGKLLGLGENAGAKEAWLAGEVEETPGISLEETALELLADHEYRLCLLELGAVEV